MAFLRKSLLMAAMWITEIGGDIDMTSRACVPDDRHCSTYQSSPKFYCRHEWTRDNCRTLCDLPCKQDEHMVLGLAGYLGGEHCLTDCSYYGEKPCCGTDGKTYRNICELYNAVCRSGNKFNFKSRGRCECEKPDAQLCKGYTNYESYYCKHPWMKNNCKYLCKICTPTPDCQANVDMGFIYEPSKGFVITYEKFFVKELAATFGVTKHNSRAGLITLDNTTSHSIKLNDFGDLIHFNDAIDKLTPIGKVAIRIDKALQIAKEEFFLSTNGARKRNPKLLVLASSSYDTKDLNIGDAVRLAEDLRRSGIIFVIIGTTPGTVNSDLIRIAGHSNNIFIANTFEELISSDFINDIVDGTCRKVLNYMERQNIGPM